MCFRNLAHRFPEDEIDWELLKWKIYHLLYIFENLQPLESFKSHIEYFGDGDAQS